MGMGALPYLRFRDDSSFARGSSAASLATFGQPLRRRMVGKQGGGKQIFTLHHRAEKGIGHTREF